MQRLTKFLLISNMRTGSTWLTTTLGALPDVVTDYEIKWKVEYPPQKVHRVLDEQSSTVSQILDDLAGDKPIAGSKFVFDPVDMPRPEFLKLMPKLVGDVRIVHLVRRYRDIFLSGHRGIFHHFDDATSWRIGDHLRSAFGSRPERLDRPAEPVHVSRVACYEELKIFLQNDVWASLLRDAGVPYLLVSYENLRESLPEIAKFVGSRATLDSIAAVLTAPVTFKLPELPASRIVSNIDELEPLFQEFERLRAHVLGDAIAKEYETHEPSSPQRASLRVLGSRVRAWLLPYQERPG
jgi:hypothetical protein